MKRILTVATIMAALVPGILPAESNPFIGTWKENTAKSQDNSGPIPKSRTLTFEAQGNGVKGSSDGEAADGSRFAYSYTANYDGKDNPISGTGVPNGADTLSMKRIHPNTIEMTWKRTGKVVLTSRLVVSKDGKGLTITSKGTDPSGLPTSRTLVFEKQ
jgi:hypothetical protein